MGWPGKKNGLPGPCQVLSPTALPLWNGNGQPQTPGHLRKGPEISGTGLLFFFFSFQHRMETKKPLRFSVTLTLNKDEQKKR